MIHHILGSSSFFLTFYTEDVPVVFGVLSLALEVSTIFLDLRWFTFEFKIPGTLIPLINSSLLTISYLVFRVFYQTYIGFVIAYPQAVKLFITMEDANPGKFPRLYQVTGIYFLVINLLSQAINYYWFSLIINQVIRNFKKATGQKVGDAVDMQRESTDKQKKVE